MDFDSSLADLTYQVRLLQHHVLTQFASIVDELQQLQVKHREYISPQLHLNDTSDSISLDKKEKQKNSSATHVTDQFQVYSPTSVGAETINYAYHDPSQILRSLRANRNGETQNYMVLRRSKSSRRRFQESFEEPHLDFNDDGVGRMHSYSSYDIRSRRSSSENSSFEHHFKEPEIDEAGGKGQTDSSSSRLVEEDSAPFFSTMTSDQGTPKSIQHEDMGQQLLPLEPLLEDASHRKSTQSIFAGEENNLVVVKQPPQNKLQQAVQSIQHVLKRQVTDKAKIETKDIDHTNAPAVTTPKRQSRESSSVRKGNLEVHQKVMELASVFHTSGEDTKNILSLDSKFKTNWDIFMAVSAIYMMCLVPLDLAFNIYNRSMIIFEVILETLFLADIWLHFNHVSYRDQVTKNEVLNRKKIRKRYIRGDLKIDLISSIPLTLLLLPFQNFRHGSFFNTVKFIRILKTMRILKARNTLKEIEKISSNPSLLRMFKISVIFFGICHYMGCISVYLTCTLSILPRDTATYLERCKPYGSLKEKFTAGFFYAVRMMVGDRTGGDTLEEMQIEMIYLLIGMGVSSTIIGGLASLLGSLDATLVAKNAEMDNVKEYLKRMKVQPQLQTKITQYYEYLWDIGQSSYNNQVLIGLPPRLSLELTLDFKKTLIKRCPLFKLFDAATVLQLIQGMKSIITLPEDLVIQQGEEVDSVYIIGRGIFSQLHYHMEKHRTIYIQTVHPGSYFGDIQVLGLKKYIDVSFVAESFGELQVIDGTLFLKVLKSFPRVEKRMSQLSKIILDDQDQKIKSQLENPKSYYYENQGQTFVSSSLHSMMKAKQQSEKRERKEKVQSQRREKRGRYWSQRSSSIVTPKTFGSKKAVTSKLRGFSSMKSSGSNRSGQYLQRTLKADDDIEQHLAYKQAMAGVSHHTVMKARRSSAAQL